MAGYSPAVLLQCFLISSFVEVIQLHTKSLTRTQTPDDCEVLSPFVQCKSGQICESDKCKFARRCVGDFNCPRDLMCSSGFCQPPCTKTGNCVHGLLCSKDNLCLVNIAEWCKLHSKCTIEKPGTRENKCTRRLTKERTNGRMILQEEATSAPSNYTISRASFDDGGQYVLFCVDGEGRPDYTSMYLITLDIYATTTPPVITGLPLFPKAGVYDINCCIHRITQKPKWFKFEEDANGTSLSCNKPVYRLNTAKLTCRIRLKQEDDGKSITCTVRPLFEDRLESTRTINLKVKQPRSSPPVTTSLVLSDTTTPFYRSNEKNHPPSSNYEAIHALAIAGVFLLSVVVFLLLILVVIQLVRTRR